MPSLPPSSRGRVPGARGGRARKGCSTRARRRGDDARGRGRRRGCSSAAAATRTEHLRCRLQQCPRLRVAVGRLPNRVAVDPERDVVEKEAAVHLRHVDRRARLRRWNASSEPTRSSSIDAEIEREVVAGAGGNADRKEARVPRRLPRRRPASRRRRRRLARPRRHRPPPRPALRKLSSGRRTITSIPRSRARLPRSARAALPPPDFGFMKSTGRCGGSAQLSRSSRRAATCGRGPREDQPGRYSLSEDALPTCSPAASSGRSRPWSRSQA